MSGDLTLRTAGPVDDGLVKGSAGKLDSSCVPLACSSLSLLGHFGKTPRAAGSFLRVLAGVGDERFLRPHSQGSLKLFQRTEGA